jgi:hypothetical protein
VSDPNHPDGLELTRRQWAREKAAGLWDPVYLEEERTKRRAWIEEQLRLREQNAREAFRAKHATGPEG